MNVEIKPDVTNKIGIWKNLTVYQKQFHIKTGQKIQEYFKCIIFWYHAGFLIKRLKIVVELESLLNQMFDLNDDFLTM